MRRIVKFADNAQIIKNDETFGMTYKNEMLSLSEATNLLMNEVCQQSWCTIGVEFELYVRNANASSFDVLLWFELYEFLR